MSLTRKFIVNLLQLKGLFLYDYTFNLRAKTLLLSVKPYKNGCCCPQCKHRGRIVHIHTTPRLWRDLTICGWTIFFTYAPKEILCKKHGRVQEDIPWANSYARVTYRFEYALLIYCQIMTQKAAARLLHISPSTLSDLLHQSIQRLRADHKIIGLKSIGIDEISYCKGHKFATIVYDLDRSCVVWVGKGKGRKTIDRFFNECLSDYQKSHIQSAACDMSEAYLGALQDHCPNATLVLDRFHIVKAIHAALDDIRKEQWRQAAIEDRKVFKGLRWLLFKRSSNRSKKESRVLNTLSKANRRIHRAWVLKDEFDHFWNYKYSGSAEKFFKYWTRAALRTRLEPFEKLVKTLRKYKDQILAFIETRITNAVAEGINRIIKIVKNRASGFRNLESFTDMIFLTVGDVNLPGKISPIFRVL